MIEIVFDVMQGDKFICTMRMKHNKAFSLTADEIAEYAFSKRPTLRKRNVHFELCGF